MSTKTFICGRYSADNHSSTEAYASSEHSMSSVAIARSKAAHPSNIHYVCGDEEATVPCISPCEGRNASREFSLYDRALISGMRLKNKGGKALTMVCHRAGGALRNVAGNDEGMSTIEYAVGSLTAAAIAAVLYMVVKSDTVVHGIESVITDALNSRPK